MRVSVNSIDEFIECLQDEKVVFADTIRVSINRNPMDGNQRNAIKFSVEIQASPVVMHDEGEYLLVAGQDCGVDYEDASKEREGSRTACALKQMIVEFADKNWRVLPGVISE